MTKRQQWTARPFSACRSVTVTVENECRKRARPNLLKFEKTSDKCSVEKLVQRIDFEKVIADEQKDYYHTGLIEKIEDIEFGVW